MKTLALLLGSLITVAPVFAQNPAPASEAPSETAPPPKRTLLKYTPPKGTTGGVRVDTDGASRDGIKLPKLFILAPDHTAFTTSEQPSIFWYQDGPVEKGKPVRLEITLLDPKNPKPLLKVGSDLSADKDGGAGIHRVQLAKQNVKLDPGVSYQLSIALVPDVAVRSKDAIAKATIQRTEPTKELSEALGKANADKASAYAANGVWFDALSALTDEIDKNPKDAGLRKVRADLLAANGLKEAAEHDKK